MCSNIWKRKIGNKHQTILKKVHDLKRVITVCRCVMLLNHRSALPIDMLDKLGRRLGELEDVLNKYAYMIITDEDRDMSPTRGKETMST